MTATELIEALREARREAHRMGMVATAAGLERLTAIARRELVAHLSDEATPNGLAFKLTGRENGDKP